MLRCNRVLLTLILLAAACGPAAKSKSSYDQIRGMVTGKTAAEVERLLGPPDTREPLLLGDERWIWWNYTYLGGEKYPPEVRGKVVHLEVTFEQPAANRGKAEAKTEWRVSEPYGVGFVVPEGDLEEGALNIGTRKGV